MRENHQVRILARGEIDGELFPPKWVMRETHQHSGWLRGSNTIVHPLGVPSWEGQVGLEWDQLELGAPSGRRVEGARPDCRMLTCWNGIGHQRPHPAASAGSPGQSQPMPNRGPGPVAEPPSHGTPAMRAIWVSGAVIAAGGRRVCSHERTEYQNDATTIGDR